MPSKNTKVQHASSVVKSINKENAVVAPSTMLKQKKVSSQLGDYRSKEKRTANNS